MTSNRSPNSPPKMLALFSILAVAGAALTAFAWWESRLGLGSWFTRYAFGDRTGTLRSPNHIADLDLRLRWDLLVILGYGVLGWSAAWILGRLAYTKFGKAAARFSSAAVIVAVAANLLENLLLYVLNTNSLNRAVDLLLSHLHSGRVAFLRRPVSALLRNHQQLVDNCPWLNAHPEPPNPPTLCPQWNPTIDSLMTHLAATAATITWCSLLLVGVAVLGAANQLRRWFVSECWYRNHRNWWAAVVADPDLPNIGNVRTEQESWVNAYGVPGARKREDYRKDERRPVTSICLSGGGIRSACVAMGAMEVFAEVTSPGRDGSNPPRLIDDVDYVISVSGGGYASGARLLAVQGRGDGPQLKLSERYQRGTVEFEYVHRHSSFIAESPADMIRALAEVLKNLLASLVTLFYVPVALGFVAGYFLAWRPVAAFVPLRNRHDVENAWPPGLIAFDRNPLSFDNHQVYVWTGLGLMLAVAVGLTGFALSVESTVSGETGHQKWARGAQGVAVFALFILGVTVLVPGLMWLCSPAPSKQSAPVVTVGLASGVVGLQFLAALVAMGWKKRGRIAQEVGGWSGRLRKLLPRGVFQLVLVLVTLGVLMAAWLVTFGTVAAGVFRYATMVDRGGHLHAVPWWWAILSVVVILVCLLGAADVTSLSLHPFYRRRLARAFAVRRVEMTVQDPGTGASFTASEAQPYGWEERTRLDQYGKAQSRTQDGRVQNPGPQFVFAAAAALAGDEATPPGMNAVSFVLGADHVGGPELGWFHTDKLIEHSPPRIARDLTVEAAVAISGAAFTTAMGRQSSWYQTLLAVSGARLGTWLPNPYYVQKLKDAETAGSATDHHRLLPRGLPIIRGASYFYRELLGYHHRGGPLVQVTDGGHYENLGLVEALRRRSQLIYCIDAGGDTPPLLAGLADAIRLARYELGITITLREAPPPPPATGNDNSQTPSAAQAAANEIPGFSVDEVAPGSGAPFGSANALACLNDRITKGTVVVGKIEYPEAADLSERRREGWLIVAKAVLWRRCPDWLLTYAAQKGNELFPHDPTTEQWFDDAQFSAYTELGRLIASNAVDAVVASFAELNTRLNGSTSDATDPEKPYGKHAKRD